MERYRFWIFLVLGLAVGLGFELMKEAAPDQERLDRLARLDTMIDEGRQIEQPTSLLQKIVKTVRPKKTYQERIAGLTAQTPPATQEIPPQTSTAQPEQAAAAAAAAGTQGKDAKKSKSKDNKKKDNKKKKKISGAKPNPVSEKPKEESPKESGDSASGAGHSSEAPAAGAFVAGIKSDPNALPETVEEWEAYLLATPDFERTSRFIKLFQTNVVKSDVFYEVLTSMLGDERTKMRELAVMALGATPSVRSFAYLTAVQAEEQGVTKLKSQVQTYLKMYTRLEYLRHLAGAMTLEADTATRVEAVRQLRFAADLHLKNGTTPSQPTEQGQPGQPRPTATQVRYFESFVGILNRLSQAETDESVRQSATAALSSLRSLLGTQTVAAQNVSSLAQ